MLNIDLVFSQILETVGFSGDFFIHFCVKSKIFKSTDIFNCSIVTQPFKVD